MVLIRSPETEITMGGSYFRNENDLAIKTQTPIVRIEIKHIVHLGSPPSKSHFEYYWLFTISQIPPEKFLGF